MWMSIEAIHTGGIKEGRQTRQCQQELEPYSPTRIEKQEKEERREMERKVNGARPKDNIIFSLIL